MKTAARPSHPRHLNLRGGLPTYQPPTTVGAEMLAAVARADGFDVTITPDCRVILHGVCQPVWDRHARTTSCRVREIHLRDAATLAHMTAARCADHAETAVA